MKRLFIVAAVVALISTFAFAAMADESDTDSAELDDKKTQRIQNLSEYFAPRLGDAEEGEEGADPEELETVLTEARDGSPSVGWGVMYKMLIYAEYSGDDIEELLDRADGEGWQLGKLFKELRNDDEWKSSSDTPKNFGQWKKQQREANGG